MLVRALAAVLIVSGIGWGLLRLAERPAAWREAIGRGEERAIVLGLEAGRMVAVGVEQVEIGLTLSVVCPDGRVVRGSDRGGFGRETLLFETKAAGEYQVVVRAAEEGPRRGYFALASVDHQRMREADEDGLRGQALFVKATELDGEMTGEARERARELYGEAARRFRAGGWRELEGLAKNSEGRALDRGGRRDAAYGCYMEALRIREQAGDEYGRAETLLQLARLRGHLKERFPFVPDDWGFLEMWRRLEDRRGIAHAMSVVSSYYRRQRKDLPGAAEWAERSVRLARELEDAPLEARCLVSVAEAARERGDHGRALRAAQRILSLQRQLGDERGESAALGRIAGVLQFAGRDGEAIPYRLRQVEMQRAQGEMTAVSESLWWLAGAYRRMGNEAAATVLQDEETAMHARIAGGFASAKWRSAYLDSASPVEGRALALVAAGRVGEALKGVDSLRAGAFGSTGEEGRPEWLRALGAESVLIETFMGMERTYIWVASGSGARVHFGPGAEKMTALAQRVWSCYATRRECREEARELSRALLGPAWREIRGKRMVICGDGILSYFPFAALPEPEGSGDVPLVEGQEIVQVPSLLAMGTRRSQMGAAEEVRQVTVLADPVYDAQDPRLGGRRASGAVQHTELRQAIEGNALELEKGAIPRLWHTALELKGLLEALPGRVERMAYTGFEATREALTRELAGGAIVHIATHGFVNEDDAEMSGLVFSLWNRKGEAVDGYFRLSELDSKRIPARLVVLSACQTACGRQYYGQGAFSLSGAFLRAGARTVVASSWKVSDEATAELMRRFYGHLMTDAGMRAPEALRAAQRELRRDPRWRLPYFWAAFGAHGEWR